jgi:hypothetical protein
MSRQAKEKAKIERAKKKAARKSANYLRCGPKSGHSGRRQTKRAKKQFKPGTPRIEPVKLSSPGPKTKAKRRRKSSIKRTNLSKLPLRPLRKRRHLGCPSREERGLE